MHSGSSVCHSLDMSKGSIDDLISDLFPSAAPLKEQSSFDDPTPLKPTQGNTTKVLGAPSSAADVDYDDDDDDGKTGRPSGSNFVPTKVAQPREGNRGSSFDDSDDEDGSGGSTSSRPLNPHVTVPFPEFPAGLVPNATGNATCILSRIGNPNLFHPTVESMRAINQHDVALLHMARCKVLAMKGAVHVTHPNAGNGVDPARGSPFIVCRRCDNAVVRLQGARWLDGIDGTRDLYLSVRNFYPDWSRLAHCTGTHSEHAAKGSQGPLLARDAQTAAYACQCAWITVDADAFTVTTQPGEVAAAGESVFRTSTTAGAQEDRRPPLWRSRGVQSGF